MISLQRLGDHIDLLGGGTPSKEVDDFWGGSIPWATVKDLKHDILENTVDRISQLGLDNSSSKLVRSGSILIATRMAVGRVVMAGVDVAINQDLKAITCDDNIDTKFLYYFLQSQNNYFNRMSSGATVKGIKVAHIMDLEIPLPPLAEQKKIAAILDAADQLRQKDQQLIDHYAALSQSLFLEMFGDVFANTKLFEMYSLGDLVDKVQIGPFGSQLHKKDYIEGGVPLVNPVHIVDSKIVVDSSFTLSKEKFESLPNYHLQLNDIVMGRRGEMGRCAVVGENESGFFCGTGSLFLRPNNAVTSEFLLRAIMSKSGKDYLERNAQGVTMKNLNKKIILNMRISVPPIELQDKFCDSIKKIAQQKRIAQANLSKSKSLFNSLLQKAFKGELTSIKAA